MASVSKICIQCGEDCSSRPRVKDRQGRYMCRACVERARRGGGAGEKAAGARAAASAATVPADDDAAVMAALLDSSPPSEACPACGDALAPGSVVCVRCGHNSQTGQQARTRAVAAPRQRTERSGPLITGRTVVFLVLGGIGLLAALSFVDPLFAYLLVLFAVFYYAISWILLWVAAFMHDVLTGVLYTFVPFYAIYFLLFKCDRPALQVHCIISIVALVVALVAVAISDPSFLAT